MLPAPRMFGWFSHHDLTDTWAPSELAAGTVAGENAGNAAMALGGMMDHVSLYFPPPSCDGVQMAAVGGNAGISPSSTDLGSFRNRFA